MRKRRDKFSDEELRTIWAGIDARKNEDEIAQSVGGIHRNTLERRLLKHHGLLLDQHLVARLRPVAVPDAAPESATAY